MDSEAPLLVVSDAPLDEAARRVAMAVREVNDASPRLAIAGGSAQGAVGVVRRLLGPRDWSRMRLTWADERCVPVSDVDSNRGSAYRSGALDSSSPPLEELPLYLDSETPNTACLRVAESLSRRFAFALDVLLLGMGEDGHIASLFPGHPALKALGFVVAVDNSPKPPSARITLTMRALQTAKHAVILATGEQKRPVVKRLLERDPSLPASGLPHLTIVTSAWG